MESIKIDGENTLKRAASWETRVELLRLELLRRRRKRRRKRRRISISREELLRKNNK